MAVSTPAWASLGRERALPEACDVDTELLSCSVRGVFVAFCLFFL